MNRMQRLGLLLPLVAALAVATALVGPAPRVARADAEPDPGAIVIAVQVVTGDTPCPSGFVKRNTNLNEGSGGNPVYTCLRFARASFNFHIEELYVRQNAINGDECHAADTHVPGDLNSGVFTPDHFGLLYCIHLTNTDGGSAYMVHPRTLSSGGYTTYFPTPSGKALHDVQFLVFSPDNPPRCISNDCVDSGAGAFSYLELGRTIDPYCRNSFGANYHPMFRSWEYYESDGDQGVAVPKDSEVFNLNAGTLFVPLIYACVSYINPDMTPPTLTASATTADGQPYTYNTWTNQDVTVQLTCADNPGGTGVEYPPDPATQTVSGASGLEYVTASCTDYASNATTKSFGPILVDQTKPVITPSAMTADGRPYTAGTWTNQDVTVSFTCADPGDYSGEPQSGIATNTVAGAMVGGEGANQSVANTGACVDAVGNVASPVTYGPIKIDKTRPVLAASATAADGQPYTPGVWTNQDVTVSFTCADAGAVQAGLAANTVAGQTLRADGANLAVANIGACVDNAGNAADPVTFGPIKIDKSPPTIGITAPAQTTYLLHQAVAAGYTCADPLADGTTPGSGVATCAGTAVSGAAIDTATVGTKTFTVNARDALGNASSLSVTYTVAYDVCVLYDQTQAHKAGSTVPIKLALCDAAGNNVSADSIVVHATGLKQVSTNASSAVVDAGNANPDSDFRYAGGFYIFNLQTTGLATGTWQLSFAVAGDPTTHTLQFQVR